jgi:hypothetical protein
MAWWKKPDYTAILAGIGFYKLSERRRKILTRVLIGSLLAHVLVMLIFGSYVIVKAIAPEKTVFIAPPPMRTYEPRKLEFKVKVQKQQRSSSRPSMIPRMVSTRVSDIALPEIKMDPKIIKTSFQPKFKAVSGTGLGVGLGTGFGEGGFGTGVAQFDFFGIRGRGDKIAILVDISVSMVEDIRGGPKGYQRVRERIDRVVDALNEQALFNVVVFADAASAFEKEMVVAIQDNKTKAKLWLRPFNTQGNYGLTSGNLTPADIGLKAAGGTTRLDLALTAAFEQGADTILIISDGIPRVRKAVTPEQAKAQAALRDAWYAANAEALRAWDADGHAATYSEERVWIPPTPARPPAVTGLKEGQPIDQGSPAVPGHWDVRRVGGSRRPRPEPPVFDPGWWTLSDFIQHLKILHEVLYVKKGKKLPVIHSIGYAIDQDGGEFLRVLSETYKGRYRRVAKLD